MVRPASAISCAPIHVSIISSIQGNQRAAHRVQSIAHEGVCVEEERVPIIVPLLCLLLSLLVYLLILILRCLHLFLSLMVLPLPRVLCCYPSLPIAPSAQSSAAVLPAATAAATSVTSPSLLQLFLLSLLHILLYCTFQFN